MRAPRIERPTLEIDRVPGHSGRRRLRVEYHLVIDPDDEIVGHEITERIVVWGVDLGDAPISAGSDPPAVIEDSVTAAAGETVRVNERDVDRVALDVETDWWSSGNAGETLPIAEWPDHVLAHIRLAAGGVTVCEALTPVVTGSWGALGDT